MNNPHKGWLARLAHVRRPSITLGLTVLLIGITARPAAADIDGCSTTQAARDLFNLVVNSIVNPIEEFGWKAVAVIGAIAVAAMIVGSSGAARWLKVTVIGAAAMAIFFGLGDATGLYESLRTSGGSGC